MRAIPILLVADEQKLIDTVFDALALLADVQVEVVASCAQAGYQMERLDPALVLVHLAAPADPDKAAKLLRLVTASGKNVATVLLSEPELAEDTPKLLRLGAADCLMRPLDLSRLAYLADVLTVRHRLNACPKPEAPISALISEHGFISPPAGPLAMVLEQVHRVAPLKTCILLQGETGTGKTRLAKLTHDLSPRRVRPFLTINCGALSASIIESELFGHVRGAFTGADNDRIGKLAAVGEGTLLLDDIDGLPLDLQAKLLQAIEERVFVPVGSNQPRPLKARVIAASNRLLLEEVKSGRFRADLYYRLGVVVFDVPPLRDNREMVPVLAKRFVQEYAERDSRPVRGVIAAALRALQRHDWPGNVRELRNVIERAVALCVGEWIGLQDLPDALQPIGAVAPLAQGSAAEWAEGVTLAEWKKETEEHVIREVLHRNRNNKLRTAAELGISRMTLYKKLQQYGLMEEIAPA